MLILLFMAVTSSTSAELIAVSSLLTFDVYKTYWKPDSSSAKLVQISHYGIIIYATVLAAFCCILNAVGLNLTWLLTVLGIIVGGGAVPVGLVLLWDRMSTIATIATPIIGFCLGLISWFITTSQRSGEITVASTGDTTNAVAGNLASCAGGAIIAVALSFIFPGKHVSTDPKDIERYNKIQGITSSPQQASATPSPPSESAETDEKRGIDTAGSVDEKQEPSSAPVPETFVPTGNELVDFLETAHMQPMDPVLVKKGVRLATIANWTFALVALILVPFTLFGTQYIYNRAFFRGWVVVSFIWVWVSMCICVIYPVVESRNSIWNVSVGMWGDIMALLGRRKAKVGRGVEGA